jgi:hypothetical protein
MAKPVPSKAIADAQAVAFKHYNPLVQGMPRVLYGPDVSKADRAKAIKFRELFNRSTSVFSWPTTAEDWDLPIEIANKHISELWPALGPEASFSDERRDPRDLVVRMGNLCANMSEIEVFHDGLLFSHPIVWTNVCIVPLDGGETVHLHRGGRPCANVFRSPSDEYPISMPVMYVRGLVFARGTFSARWGILTYFSDCGKYKYVAQANLASVLDREAPWAKFPDHEKPDHLRYDDQDMVAFYGAKDSVDFNTSLQGYCDPRPLDEDECGDPLEWRIPGALTVAAKQAQAAKKLRRR